MLRLQLIVLGGDNAQLLNVLPALLAVRVRHDMRLVVGPVDHVVEKLRERCGVGKGDQLVEKAEEAHEGADGAFLEGMLSAWASETRWFDRLGTNGGRGRTSGTRRFLSAIPGVQSVFGPVTL